jgi:phage-related protein
MGSKIDPYRKGYHVDKCLPWTVCFYEEDCGICPVEKFLLSLSSNDDRMRIAESVRKLCLRNISARLPLARHLEDKLWELRAESCTNIYRLIYFIDQDRHIIILHGFHKKTQKTPLREIAIARRRYENHLRRL